MRRCPKSIGDIRALFSAKLGLCPFCMGWSMIGTLQGWSAYAALAFLWPNATALVFAMAVASLFSLLTLAHLVTHMARVARALRRLEREPESASAAGLPVNHRFGRRELTWNVCRAGVGFTIVALSNWRPLFGQQKCGDLTLNIGTFGQGDTPEAAVEAYITNSRQVCDDDCQGPFTLVTCKQAGQVCLRSGDPTLTKPKVKQEEIGRVKTWIATGKILLCPCNCYSCNQAYPPVAGFDQARGSGQTREAARPALLQDAATVCGNFCERIKTCTGQTVCKVAQNGAAVPENSIKCKKNPDTKLFDCTGTISSCKCAC